MILNQIKLLGHFRKFIEILVELFLAVAADSYIV